MTRPDLHTAPEGERVIVMKVGTHAGETLPAILDRKRREAATVGWCLWGYGGSACHPLTQVQPHATAGPVTVWFIETTSVPAPNGLTATEYSADRITWQPLPPGHQVTGSKWALALADLSTADFETDLSALQAAVGPSAGKPLSTYLQGRSDKACAVTCPPGGEPQTVRIAATARLAHPYGVFVR